MSSIPQDDGNGTRDLSSLSGGESVEPLDWKQQAIADLEFQFDGCPSDSLIIVNTLTPYWQTHKYRLDQLDRIAQDWAGKIENQAVYARLTVLRQDADLEPNARGKKAHTYGAAMLKVDIDPDGTDDFRERKLEEIRAFTPAPSVIVSSGGGYYAGWKIPFTEDWQRLERITKWLVGQLGEGADSSVWDSTHLYRIAGTFNAKEKVRRFAELIEQHPERTYTLDDFGEADFSQEEKMVLDEDYGEEALPLGFEQQVRATSEKLWSRIYSEVDALEAGSPVKVTSNGPRVDRNRNDFYIALSLLRFGLTRGQVMSVLTHQSWLSGSKFRQTRSTRYVKLTIANAARLAVDDDLKKSPEIAKRLMEEMDLLNHLSYWYRYNSDKGVYEECEDELLLRIQALAGQNWNGHLEINVLKYMRPHVRLDTLPSSEFINVRNGMLDWRTGTLHKHSSAYKSIMQVNAFWHEDGNVDYSEVKEFVSYALDDDALPIWWGFNGICLDSRLPQPYRCILGLVGRRKTGKSTLLKALSMFIGEENTSSVTLDALTGGGNQFTTSGLVGSMVNLDMDAPYDIRIKENHTLKAISGGDKTNIERKHHDQFRGVYLPTKFAFGMNRVPTFGAVDEAFYDRWRVLQVRKGRKPFERKDGVMKINAQVRLLAQQKNRDAWLHLSIEGLQEVEANEGFPGRENRVVHEGLREMRLQGDGIYRFLDECTEPAPDNVSGMVLYHQMYSARIKDEGGFPVSRTKFRASLQEVAEEDHFPGLVVHHDSHQWTIRGRRLIPSLI